MIRSPRSSAGFTLIEMLVGVTLGLLLVSALMMFFVSNKRHFLIQQDATRLQENQRFAVQFLTRDIQGAGYRGCAGGRDGPLFNLLKNPTNLENEFAIGIEGFDNVSATPPARLAVLGVPPNVGTDVLVLRGPEGDSVGVSSENSNTQVFGDLVSQDPGACADGSNEINGMCAGDYLLISDCQKARVFQAGSITASGSVATIDHPVDTGSPPGNSDATWGGVVAGVDAPPNERFDIDSEIVRYGTFTYFIANRPSGDPALYRATNADTPEELVEGVEDMQILYGENTDADVSGTPDVFVTAAGVTDWDDVVAVRIELLLRGFEDHLAEGNQEYTFNGSTVTAADRRLHSTAMLTSSLRNRLP